MTPSLSERLVTIANRLGASFHAAVRAARNEWRLGSDDAKTVQDMLDRLSGLPRDVSTVDSFKDSRANPGDRLPGGKSTPAAVDGSEGAGAGMEAGMALPPRPATTGAPAPDEPDPRYAEHDEHCTCTKCRGLEGTRPAPSSTKCLECQDGWTMGHACKDVER